MTAEEVVAETERIIAKAGWSPYRPKRDGDQAWRWCGWTMLRSGMLIGAMKRNKIKMLDLERAAQNGSYTLEGHLEFFLHAIQWPERRTREKHRLRMRYAIAVTVALVLLVIAVLMTSAQIIGVSAGTLLRSGIDVLSPQPKISIDRRPGAMIVRCEDCWLIETSSNLVDWTPHSVNAIVQTNLAQQMFFRAR